MTARQKKDSQGAGRDLGPLMPQQSLYTSRGNRSERFTGIAGIGYGIQDVRSVSSGPGTKTAKHLPTIVKAEKPGRSLVSKAVQVSSNEENVFLSRIETLEKEIHSLKTSLKERDVTVTVLNETIKTKTLQFTRDMEQEINDHKSTRQMLERSQRIVEEKEQRLKENIQHYEKVNRELQDQYEERLKSLLEKSQIEVKIRDEKIDKLKLQISELFKDKSWEHQKQIEELQKEMKRLVEETHVLRGQMKRHSTATRDCEKCESLLSALEDSRLQIKLKNRTIEELQSICQRFQHQLQEQEKLQSVILDKNRRNQK